MVFPQYIQLLVHIQVSTVQTLTQISLGRGSRCNSCFITRYQSKGFDQQWATQSNHTNQKSAMTHNIYKKNVLKRLNKDPMDNMNSKRERGYTWQRWEHVIILCSLCLMGYSCTYGRSGIIVLVVCQVEEAIQANADSTNPLAWRVWEWENKQLE